MQPHSTFTLSELAKEIFNKDLQHEVFTFDVVLTPKVESRFPMRIDGLMVGVCVDGEAYCEVDLTEYHITRNSLIIVQSYNFLSTARIIKPCRLLMTACSSLLLEKILPAISDLLPMMLTHRNRPVIQISIEDAHSLMAFYNLLRAKLTPPYGQYTNQKVAALLQAGLYELIDIHNRHELTEPIVYKSRREELMAKFLFLINENFREHREVAYYANELCISSKHLTSVTKSLTGRTASYWIDTYVIMESKILLRTSDRSIQEISAMLNFPNQSFFGRFFKFHTGHSPSEFRLLSVRGEA